MAASSIFINICNVAVPFVTTGAGNVEVYCMDIDPASGDIYIGGNFTTVNGVTRNGLACITRKGILKSWNPGINSGIVQAIKFVSTSLIYVGGSFTGIGGGTGTTACNFQAAVDSTSAVIAGYAPANIFGPVSCFDVDVNGNVFFGCGFPLSSAGGAAAVTTAGVRLNWFPIFNTSATAITSIKCAGTGTSTMVYLGGNFSQLNGLAGIVTRNSLAQINGFNSLGTDGKATAWVANCTFLGTTPVYVRSICLDSGGTLYAAGEFDAINGTSRPNGLAAMSGAGPTLGSWAPSSGGLFSAVVMANGLDIYWASRNGGTGVSSGLTGCMDSAGTAHAWDAKTGPTGATFIIGNQVNCMVADQSNPLVPVVYVAGFFQAVLGNTIARGSLAKFADRTVSPTRLAY